MNDDPVPLFDKPQPTDDPDYDDELLFELKIDECVRWYRVYDNEVI